MQKNLIKLLNNITLDPSFKQRIEDKVEKIASKSKNSIDFIVAACRLLMTIVEKCIKNKNPICKSILFIVK